MDPTISAVIGGLSDRRISTRMAGCFGPVWQIAFTHRSRVASRLRSLPIHINRLSQKLDAVRTSVARRADALFQVI
jgi:hypothetical protein